MDETRRGALLKEYSEVAHNFRLLSDIRFKLLTALPIATAAAVALKGGALDFERFGLSLFGLVVTLGLATYNARNDQLYDELVGRAASIERSLGLPDGYFANRPRAWLDVPLVPLGNLRWKIDHRIGIAAIYAASVALWASGVLAPTLEFVRRVYPGLPARTLEFVKRLFLDLPPPTLEFVRPVYLFFAVRDPAIVVNSLAITLAIVLTVLGILIIWKHKERREKKLREWAAEAVEMATGLTAGSVVENKDLLSRCVKLSGEKPKTIWLRAQFYRELDAESVGHYLPSGSPKVTAAHMVANLTDLSAGWLFDCATNRRGMTAQTDRQPGLVHASATNWSEWLLLLGGVISVLLVSA